MSPGQRLGAQQRRQFIAGLRAVADLYERHPDAYYDGIPITLAMYVWGNAARKTLRAMALAFGRCSKVYDDRNVTVAHSFSPQVTLAVFAPRAKVCRRVVTGECILPARILPAAGELVIPACRQELVEWQCDPLLPAGADI